MLQGFDKVARGRKALIAALSQGFSDDGIPNCGQCDVNSRGRNRCLGQYLLRNGVAATGKRPYPGQKLVQDHAAGEKVGPPIHRQHFVLLGRHVGRRANPRAHLRHHGRFDFCHTKVGHLDAPITRNHDVGGLDITMHHLVSMGMVKRIQNLAHDANDLFEIEFLARVEIILQLFTADVLHRDKGDITGLTVVVDGDHAWVIEPAGCLRFLFESPEQGLGFRGVKTLL